MEKRGVIDVERDLANYRQWRIAISKIVNPEILHHQAAEGIEREPADGGFDPALAEFFDHASAELTAKPPVSEIPATPKQKSEKGEKDEARSACCQLPPPGPAPIEGTGDAPFFRRMQKDRRHTFQSDGARLISSNRVRLATPRWGVRAREAFAQQNGPQGRGDRQAEHARYYSATVSAHDYF